ncbi:MAG: phage portal protein, partial [Parachlamydiaceae bacterium]
MGFFDRFRSKKKTEEKQFVGAKQGRLTADWAVTNLTIDAMMRGSLKVLRMRSRDLELNNEYIRAYLRACVINVVGRGIPFQVTAKDKTGAPIKELNTKIENEFYKWTNKDSCDTAGLLSFQDIEKLAVRRHEGDGEFIVQIVRKKFGNSKVPFALQLIDPDQLDENFNGYYQGNIVRMGVEIDEWSRPVAYHFLTVNPGDASFAQYSPAQRVRIPAKDIIHLFTTERTGQTRGYPRTNAAMFKLHQLKGYEEAAVVGKRVRASLMGFIQTAEGETKGDGVEGDERVYEMSPGKIAKLNEGETINVPNFGGDSGAETEPFMAAMLRAVGATLGV